MFGMWFGANLPTEKADKQPAAKVLFVCTGSPDGCGARSGG
jgi:hypothetical protein